MQGFGVVWKKLLIDIKTQYLLTWYNLVTMNGQKNHQCFQRDHLVALNYHDCDHGYKIKWCTILSLSMIVYGNWEVGCNMFVCLYIYIYIFGKM